MENKHLDQKTTKSLIETIGRSLEKMESVVFLLQTDLENYTKEEMDELLSIIFNAKNEKLRYFSLGFCADDQKFARPTNFDLDHFGNLLKQNTWNLLKFELYYEVKNLLTKGEIKKFLLILIKWLTFSCDLNVELMSCGIDLLKEFGFSEIMEKHSKNKKRAIFMAGPLNILQKKFRKEIINEVLKKLL